MLEDARKRPRFGINPWEIVAAVVIVAAIIALGYWYVDTLRPASPYHNVKCITGSFIVYTDENTGETLKVVPVDDAPGRKPGS